MNLEKAIEFTDERLNSLSVDIYYTEREKIIKLLKNLKGEKNGR